MYVALSVSLLMIVGYAWLIPLLWLWMPAAGAALLTAAAAAAGTDPTVVSMSISDDTESRLRFCRFQGRFESRLKTQGNLGKFIRSYVHTFMRS